MTRSQRAAAAGMAGVLLVVLLVKWREWQAEEEEKMTEARVPEGLRKAGMSSFKSKLAQHDFEFEPADPQALEKEERRAEIDKIHKGFLPDPYKLAVHVDISTSTSLTSTSTLADELRDVTSVEDGSLEQQLKVNGMPVHVDLRGEVKETRAGQDGTGSDEEGISAVIWITGKTESTFSRASEDAFRQSLAEVLHIDPNDIKLSLSGKPKPGEDSTTSSKGGQTAVPGTG
eukprot:766852-Hanusia_phi.AAC.1